MRLEEASQWWAERVRKGDANSAGQTRSWWESVPNTDYMLYYPHMEPVTHSPRKISNALILNVFL